MTYLSPSLNQPKRKEKEGFKEDESERELAVLPKQRNREKKDCQEGESEIGPGEQHGYRASYLVPVPSYLVPVPSYLKVVHVAYARAHNSVKLALHRYIVELHVV